MLQSRSHIFSADSPDPFSLVIFGASGDLTQRKLLPALASLFKKKALPQDFFVAGLSRRAVNMEVLRKEIDAPETFWRNIHFIESDYGFASLTRFKSEITEKKRPRNFLFYLATPPNAFVPISRSLKEAGLVYDNGESQWSRIIYEKPFGVDLQSAQTLNNEVLECFQENQIYRIDHYLGKGAIQNLMVFRFANPLFESVWNSQFIDHIQISASEKIGVLNRAGYFDSSGMLRDMVQNHLMQVLCLLTMEAPLSLSADDIRQRKVEVLKQLRIPDLEGPTPSFVRGQYAGYRAEKDVPPRSTTETFAALKLFIDSDRFHGVPVYLRSGKKLNRQATEIAVILKPRHKVFFDKNATVKIPPNKIIFKIQPGEGIIVELAGKSPSTDFKVENTRMNFSYKDQFEQPVAEAYETLLLDALRGNPTLFVRSDEVEESWRIMQPLLEYVKAKKGDGLEEYPENSRGPVCAETLLARDGRAWTDFSVYDPVE